MTKRNDFDAVHEVADHEADAESPPIAIPCQGNANPIRRRVVAILPQSQSHATCRRGSKRSVCWSIPTFNAVPVAAEAVETETKQTKAEVVDGNVFRQTPFENIYFRLR